MKDIYIVGSINTDLVMTTPVMPKRGETLVGSGFFSAHGGKGANQAVAAARLGGNVHMCGCVGDDSFGMNAISSLVDEKIDVSSVRAVLDTPSGTAVIIVEEGDNRIILEPGANAKLLEIEVEDFISRAKPGDIYLTQLENPIEVIGHGLKKAKERGLYVILNPAPANKDIIPYLEYCDLVIPNETELELLGGKEYLLSKVKTLITTLGSKGFEIADKNGSTTYPAIKVTPKDTTAAGDTLCGGLCAALSEGKDLASAAKFGSYAASIACTRLGAQPSIPKKEEIRQF